MKSGFYYSQPKGNNQLTTVKDVMDQVEYFDLMFELGANGSVNNCTDSVVAANWRKYVREAAILNYGDPVDIDFFRHIAGGEVKTIPATKIHIKSMQDLDMNIYATADVTGASPGAAAWFVIAKDLHETNGKTSYVNENGSLYNFYNGQMLHVLEVDRTTDHAHRVKVQPHHADDTVVIKEGRALLVDPARFTKATSTPSESMSFVSDGYIAAVEGWKMRDDWHVLLEMDAAYREIIQFSEKFGTDGMTYDSWSFKAQADSRRNLRLKLNLAMFLGQKMTNTDLVGTVVDEKFPGFEGYDNILKYGGGMVYQYAKQMGFSLKHDMSMIMLRQDARKKSAEYLVLDALPFRLALENRGDIDFNKVPGSCTFETFERMGGDKDEIRRLGIKSWHYANATLHFQNFGVLSDKRFLGHGDFPHTAYMMPSVGVKDTDGNMVSPIEFYRPSGYEFYEKMLDHRELESKTEKVSGYCMDTMIMAIHAPSEHVKIVPRSY